MRSKLKQNSRFVILRMNFSIDRRFFNRSDWIGSVWCESLYLPNLIRIISFHQNDHENVTKRNEIKIASQMHKTWIFQTSSRAKGLSDLFGLQFLMGVINVQNHALSFRFTQSLRAKHTAPSRHTNEILNTQMTNSIEKINVNSNFFP